MLLASCIPITKIPTVPVVLFTKTLMVAVAMPREWLIVVGEVMTWSTSAEPLAGSSCSLTPGGEPHGPDNVKMTIVEPR